MKLIYISAGLLLTTAIKVQRPFKLGDMTIDFDEVPELPDQVNYQKQCDEDMASIEEAKSEVKAAQNNAEKGDLNREMATALLQDAKKHLTDIEGHLNVELKAQDEAFNQASESQSAQSFIQTDNIAKNNAMIKKRVTAVLGMIKPIEDAEQSLGMLGENKLIDDDFVQLKKHMDKISEKIKKNHSV